MEDTRYWYYVVVWEQQPILFSGNKYVYYAPYPFRISHQESWGTYFVCTSYGVRLNFVIASRLIKRYPAMPANVARSLFIHSRDTKTVWNFHQTVKDSP